MKKLFFILSIAFYALYPSTCKADIINVPVYMALTGNDIIITGGSTSLKLYDSQNSITPVLTFFDVSPGGFNSGIIQFNNTIYIGSHAVYLGDVQIDTEETYHLTFLINNGGLSFTTWGVMGEQGYTTPGPVYTQGFGVYFTTWDNYNDYTLGEVAFTISPGPITGPLQINYNNPGRYIYRPWPSTIKTAD